MCVAICVSHSPYAPRPASRGWRADPQAYTSTSDDGHFAREWCRQYAPPFTPVVNRQLAQTWIHEWVPGNRQDGFGQVPARDSGHNQRRQISATEGEVGRGSYHG